MKTTTTFLLAGLALVLPAITSAAVYQYVDTSGFVRSLEAVNAEDALRRVPALGGDPRTGVMLYSGTVQNGGPTSATGLYGYISANGTYKVISASSPAAALALATDIHPQSGIIALD